jgi:2'-5' RNA ligase
VDDANERERYALLVRLPRAVEIRIEDVYLNLASVTKPNMGYHITLLGPFHMARVAHALFQTSVEAVCRHWSPFHLRITGLGEYKASDDNVVFLRIANPQDLTALHRDLLEATQDQILAQDERLREWNFQDFEPHVTLGLGLTDQELDHFMRAAAGCAFDESYEVTRVWLAGGISTGPWQYIASYTLGDSGDTEASPESAAAD